MRSKEESGPERTGRHEEAPRAGRSTNAPPPRIERRSEFRVSDDQRSGRGADSAWSRMSMLERRKRMWVRVRRDEEV